MSTQAASSSESVQFGLNLSQLCQEKARIRTQLWDPAFQENHEAFAVEFATFIAREAIAKFSEGINAFNRDLSGSCHFIHTHPLDFTDEKVATDIVAHLKNAKELPPFKEWLNAFTTPTTEVIVDQEFLSSRRVTAIPYIDLSYFMGVIKTVGKCVKRTINSMLSQEALKPENRDLRFHVMLNYCPQDDASETKLDALIQKTSIIAVMPNYKIHITMWVDSSDESPVDEASSTSLTGRVQQLPVDEGFSTSLAERVQQLPVRNRQREIIYRIGIVLSLIGLFIFCIAKTNATDLSERF